MKFKTIGSIALALTFGCTATIDFDLPRIEEPVVEMTPNSNIRSVINQYVQSGEEIYSFPENSNTIIEGVVVSSDEAGNFYKNLIIQDTGNNESKGVSLMIDLRASFTRYEIGRKLYLRIAGLSMYGDHGNYKLGYEKMGGLTGIPESLLDQFIIRSETRIQLEVPFVTASGINADKLNTKIGIRQVQFEKEDLGKTFAGEPYDSYYALRPLRICGDEVPIFLSTSVYADFKSELLPDEVFDAQGILSREYDGQFVLMVNSPEDLVPTEDRRCDRDYLDCEFPQEGDDQGSDTVSTKGVIFFEDFEDIASTKGIEEAGWININIHFGGGKFVKRSSNDNTFVRISSYGTKEDVLEAWLVSPPIQLDGSQEEELSFQTRATFNKGRLMTTWVTTDFEEDPRAASWQQLEGRISDGTADGTNEKFINSGKISLACVQGTVRIAFRYLGGDPGPATTYDLDNVLVRGIIY